MRLLWDLFFSFFKIGLIAYGGGPAMVPVIETEVVGRRGWIEPADFRTAISLAYTLPGPITPQLAFWTGWRVAGLPGGIVAWIAMELPSISAMYIIGRFFWSSMGSNPYLRGAAQGAGIGVVGLLFYLAYQQAYGVFAKESGGWWLGLTQHWDWVLICLAVFAAALLRPTLMVPLSLILCMLYGAFFLR